MFTTPWAIRPGLVARRQSGIAALCPAPAPGHRSHAVTLLHQFRDFPGFVLRPGSIRLWCVWSGPEFRQGPVKENRASSPVKPLPAPLTGTSWSFDGWCLLRPAVRRSHHPNPTLSLTVFLPCRPALGVWHPRNLPACLAVILPCQGLTWPFMGLISQIGEVCALASVWRATFRRLAICGASSGGVSFPHGWRPLWRCWRGFQVEPEPETGQREIART